MSETVLITGARSAAALEMARECAAVGLTPHMADSSMSMIARFSRTPAGVHKYHSPNDCKIKFEADITALIHSLKPIIVIPTCEEIYHLASHRLSKLMANRLFAPDLNVLKRLHAKHKFVDLCNTLGLHVPETHCLFNASDLAQLAGEQDSWIFKPAYSRFGVQTLTDKIPQDLAFVSPDNPRLAQRKIIGSEVSFYALARDGNMIAFTAYSSPWRLRGGASYAFTTLRSTVVNQLRNNANELIKHLNFTGQIACDAIVDAAGKCWLIECNPRATSGIHLLAGQEDVLPAILGRSSKPIDTQMKTRYLAPAMYSFGLTQAIRHKQIPEWRKYLKQGTDVISRPNDRWPLLGAVFDTAQFSYKAWRRGISLAAATTVDIEWNGEHLS